MSDDESSFVILGSTPTPSMEQYNGHTNPMTNGNGSAYARNVMETSTQTLKNFSLMNPSISPSSMNPPSSSFLSANGGTDNTRNDSLAKSSENGDNPPTQSIMKASTASGVDFAEQFLLGEIPADSLKYSIWKQFPSFLTSRSNAEDVGKLECLINDNIKLKENLQKTNEAMHQHFSTINKWQTRVKELKETQANEIAECNEINAKLQEQLRLKTVENENLHIALLERDELNQKLKTEMSRIKEEHEEKTLQFNMNLAYAAGENKELVQEISAKIAIIQNLTNMIEKLEKQATSFELLSMQRDGHGSQTQNENSSMSRSSSSGDFVTQLNAAREQNIQLLEDVSNKISTIKRLESESSKLQHQLLSLEMIVNENGQKSNEDNETVRKLKDELNQMSIQNIQIREMVRSDYIEQIDQLKERLTREEERYQKANDEIVRLKERLAREEERYQKANDEIESLRSEIQSNHRSLNELTAKVANQQAELNELERSNVSLRSNGINADICAHQKNQEIAEIREENEFLKAQLDVYKADFEMERQSRQDIANEREELLSDLKLLQRRNQQLIEEAQSRNRATNPAATSSATPPAASAPSQSSVKPNQVGRFVCPVCFNQLANLMVLQNHVQNCLEN